MAHGHLFEQRIGSEQQISVETKLVKHDKNNFIFLLK